MGKMCVRCWGMSLKVFKLIAGILIKLRNFIVARDRIDVKHKNDDGTAPKFQLKFSAHIFQKVGKFLLTFTYFSSAKRSLESIPCVIKFNRVSEVTIAFGALTLLGRNGRLGAVSRVY